MSVYIFTKLFHLLLLLLLMCGTLICEQVWASGFTPEEADSDTVELFQTKVPITINFNLEGGAETASQNKVSATNFYFLVLVSTNNHLFALTGVDDTEKDKNDINVLSTHIEKQLLTEKNIKSTESKWKTQFPVQNKTTQKFDEIFKSILAVATKEKVYVLLVNQTKKSQSEPEAEAESQNPYEWSFMFAVGTVDDKGNPGKIKWGNNVVSATSVTDKLEEEFKKGKLVECPLGGSAFLTNDGKLAFALVVQSSEKNVTALMQFEDEKTEPKTVYTDITAENCYPYFLQLKKFFFIIPGNCSAKTEQKIMELGDGEQQWKISQGALSQQYDFLFNKQDFATVTIDSKEVLLFTEHKLTTKGQPSNKDVFLWMSDGNRLRDIGKIGEDGETVTPIRFLVVENKLYSLTQQWGGGSSNEITSVKLKYLKGQSATAKTTINAWDTIDTKIINLCTEQKSSKILCVKDGLVGFLSSTVEGNDKDEWKDEYLYKNAIFNLKNNNKIAELANGFTFSGKGAGAQWQVGKAENKNCPYNFIKSGFALLATVTTHEITAGDYNSILGIVFAEKSKVISLWCNNKKEWVVGTKEKPSASMPTSESCEHNKTYKVVIMLEKEKDELKIFIDGNKLNVPTATTMKIEKTNTILHFYFGADKGQSFVETQVTIKNVLLYNRPFNDTEINNLKVPKVAETTSAKENDGNNMSSQETNDTPLDTPKATKNNEEEVQSSPSAPTTEDSAARVGVVGVLCFMLFGVFTLLGRYVY